MQPPKPSHMIGRTRRSSHNLAAPYAVDLPVGMTGSGSLSGWISYPRNVAKAAKPPGLGRNERRALTPDEAKRLLAAMIDKRHEPLFIVALSTGLRRGELLALRWSDVDLKVGTLFVRRALQRAEGRLQFVAKTHRSARAKPPSALALKALERQRVGQANCRRHVNPDPCVASEF